MVSIYSENEYESRDLDFISPSDHSKIRTVIEDLGFEAEGKDFTHPKTDFSVEFPTGPLAIGDDVPVKAEGELKVGNVRIKMFSPTQAVMDRLAWYYFSNDMQCLDQAIMICKKQKIKLEKVKSWSRREGELEKFEAFLKRLQLEK